MPHTNFTVLIVMCGHALLAGALSSGAPLYAKTQRGLLHCALSRLLSLARSGERKNGKTQQRKMMKKKKKREKRVEGEKETEYDD